jgi:hypothetical protein
MKSWAFRSDFLSNRTKLNASYILYFQHYPPNFLYTVLAFRCLFFQSIYLSFLLHLFCLLCVWVGKLFGWFWSCVGFFERPANVLDYEALAYFVSFISSFISFLIALISLFFSSIKPKEYFTLSLINFIDSSSRIGIRIL